MMLESYIPRTTNLVPEAGLDKRIQTAFQQEAGTNILGTGMWNVCVELGPPRNSLRYAVM